jgi:integrase
MKTKRQEDKGPVATVRVGAVRIKIYDSKALGCYLAKWTHAGKQRRMKGVDLDKLKRKVKAKAKEIDKGMPDLDALDDEQLAVIREVLRRGIRIEDLGKLQGLPDAVKLSVAVSDFLAAKKASQGRSERHYRTLSGHLRTLVKAIGGARPLAEITPAELDAWLRKSSTPKTRKNRRGSLTNFFRWCQEKRMLPDGIRTAAERTDKVKVERGEIEVWTPDEMKTMLETVPAPYLPWLVIQAFAGCRTSELFPEQRNGSTKTPLSWEHVHLDREHPIIDLPAACSKTSERRTIPICDTLAAWLRPLAKRSGPICPPKSPSRRNHKEETITELLAKALGCDWRPNATRHSYGSYRTAETQSLPQVSLEMGNSLPTIKRHYHHAQTAEDAKAWFSLSPLLVDRAIRVAS